MDIKATDIIRYRLYDAEWQARIYLFFFVKANDFLKIHVSRLENLAYPYIEFALILIDESILDEQETRIQSRRTLPKLFADRGFKAMSSQLAQ